MRPGGSPRRKRYWAVVGSGANRVAAEEVRIKLSELCYKSIACDVTEDKKHIDLSSEPLILVCAAGLAGSTADDVAKEVAIFRAHKATPIVIADEGETRYPAAAVLTVPPVDPALAFVLSAMAGHLFGYEAALAIDASARPLRAAGGHRAGRRRRARGDAVLAAAARDRRRSPSSSPTGSQPPLRRPPRGITAVRLTGLLRDVPSDRPLEEYRRAPARSARRRRSIDDLALALTRAIEELTRPVDAIKHQAKTVTVGISRSDEGVLDRALVQAVLEAGAGRDVLTYRTLKVLADLDPAVAEVTGFTRYGIDGDTIAVVDRGGVSRAVPVASTATRRSSAPSTGSPASARCSSPAAAATGDRDPGPEVKAGRRRAHAAAGALPRPLVAAAMRVRARRLRLAMTASSTG